MRVSDLGKVAIRLALHLGFDPARTQVVWECGDYYLHGQRIGSPLTHSEILESAPSEDLAIERTRQTALRNLWAELRTVRQVLITLRDSEFQSYWKVVSSQEQHLVAMAVFLEGAS
jgi:hypothetical protein